MKNKIYFLIFIVSLLFLSSCQTLEKINPVDALSGSNTDFSAPTNVYYDQDTLFWQKDPNAKEYYVYSNGNKIYTSNNNYFAYSSLAFGTYYFQISSKKYFVDSTYLIETYKSPQKEVLYYGKVVQNLRASYVSGIVILNWDIHKQAKKYYIFIDNLPIDSTTNNFYSKSISFSGTKTFGVALLRYNKMEDTTTKISLTAITTAPCLTLKSKLSYVALSWDAINSASSYSIYRKNISASSYTLIATTTSLTYNDYVSGDVYSYYIKANLSGGSTINYESKISSSIEKGEIQLTWNYQIRSGITGYKIYYASATTAFATIAFLDTSFSYFNTSENANYYSYAKNFTMNNFNQTYTMEITAYAFTNESNRASRTVTSTIFAPTNLSIVAMSDSLKINWSHSIGADYYYIYRSTQVNTGYTDSLLLSDTEFKQAEFIDKNGRFSTFSSNTTYYYKLKAKNDTYGFSYFSYYIKGKSN